MMGCLYCRRSGYESQFRRAAEALFVVLNVLYRHKIVSILFDDRAAPNERETQSLRRSKRHIGSQVPLPLSCVISQCSLVELQLVSASQRMCGTSTSSAFAQSAALLPLNIFQPAHLPFMHRPKARERSCSENRA